MSTKKKKMTLRDRQDAVAAIAKVLSECTEVVEAVSLVVAALELVAPDRRYDLEIRDWYKG